MGTGREDVAQPAMDSSTSAATRAPRLRACGKRNGRRGRVGCTSQLSGSKAVPVATNTTAWRVGLSRALLRQGVAGSAPAARSALNNNLNVPSVCPRFWTRGLKSATGPTRASGCGDDRGREGCASGARRGVFGGRRRCREGSVGTPRAGAWVGDGFLVERSTRTSVDSARRAYRFLFLPVRPLPCGAEHDEMPRRADGGADAGVSSSHLTHGGP